MSGLSFVTARTDGGVPVNVRPAYSDVGTGMLAALGVVAALRHRDLTGEGQRVETSLLATALLFGQTIVGRFPSMLGDATERFHAELAELRAAGGTFEDERRLYRDRIAGGEGVLRFYFRHYRTADGMISVGCLSTSLFDKFQAVTGLPDPRTDPAHKMATPGFEALIAEAEALFATEPTAVWLERFRAVGVPCARGTTCRPRCSTTLRSWPTTTPSSSTTRRSASTRCRRPPCGSTARPRRPASQRRPSTRTPTPCSPSSASAPPRSPPGGPKVSSDAPVEPGCSHRRFYVRAQATQRPRAEVRGRG